MLEVHVPQGVEVQVLSWAPIDKTGFISGFFYGSEDLKTF